MQRLVKNPQMGVGRDAEADEPIFFGGGSGERKCARDHSSDIHQPHPVFQGPALKSLLGVYSCSAMCEADKIVR